MPTEEARILTTQPLTAARAPVAREACEAASAPAAPTRRAGTAFDLALANHALYSARERYALQRGAYGTPEYWGARLLFTQKIAPSKQLSLDRRAGGRATGPRRRAPLSITSGPSVEQRDPTDARDRGAVLLSLAGRRLGLGSPWRSTSLWSRCGR